MIWDWNYAFEILPDLLSGLVLTILVTIVSSISALTGGLFLAMFSIIFGNVGKITNRIIIEVFRGIPILVLLFFGFYCFPLLGMMLPAFFVGVLVLGLVYAAYCSEVYRGAIYSIPQGIKDGCHALGLPKHIT